MDQTCHFPVTSSRGSKYLMVLFDHDSNAILVKPLKSRISQELGRAYEVLHTHLCDCGIRPLFQILDNECPASLKLFMHQEGVDFQLVPLHLQKSDPYLQGSLGHRPQQL